MTTTYKAHSKHNGTWHPIAEPFATSDLAIEHMDKHYPNEPFLIKKVRTSKGGRVVSSMVTARSEGE